MEAQPSSSDRLMKPRVQGTVGRAVLGVAAIIAFSVTAAAKTIVIYIHGLLPLGDRQYGIEHLHANHGLADANHTATLLFNLLEAQFAVDGDVQVQTFEKQRINASLDGLEHGGRPMPRYSSATMTRLSSPGRKPSS